MVGEGWGPHLQVLLLPGEGVGQPLHRLRSVLRHPGLDGGSDFLEHGVDLFQKAPGLVHVIQLQTDRGRGTCVIGRAGTLISAGPRTVPPYGDGPP